jgi:predicted ABC-type ATPase
MSQPLLTIVGGPNGSGKSSKSKPYLEEGLFFLNPDEIARALNPKDVRASAMEAGRVVLNYAAQLVEERRSFALESTLSGNTPLRLVASAKTRGYRTALVYVGTDDPEINIDRVAARVAQGGHHIPTDDIIRRWHRSVEGLPRYLKAVDAAWVVDNSGEVPRLIAQTVGGVTTVLYPPVPNWVDQAINRLL